jgi:CRP-like cAMP-binding protein
MQETIAQRLKSRFDPYFEAPLEVWQTFAEYGELTEVPKHTVLKPHGFAEKYFYFILKGSGGIFLFNHQNDVCIDLCYEGEYFGDYLSFLTSTPTEMETRCLEPCVLFKIHKTNFEKLASTPIGLLITKNAAESLFIHKQTQQLDLLTKTAEQRYLARGYADVENGIQATPETTYRIGSTSKAVTATAMMRLVQEGKLNLDQPVAELLSTYPATQWPMTTRQLLSHTAGIPDYGDLGPKGLFYSLLQIKD